MNSVAEELCYEAVFAAYEEASHEQTLATHAENSIFL
jgi:hypothetical protein